MQRYPKNPHRYTQFAVEVLQHATKALAEGATQLSIVTCDGRVPHVVGIETTSNLAHLTTADGQVHAHPIWTIISSHHLPSQIGTAA